MNKDSLKQYLSTPYQGWQSFLENVIFPIFGSEDFKEGHETELLDNEPQYRLLADTTGVRSIKQIGTIPIGIENLEIFDVTVSDSVKMERNRVGIQRLIRSVMDPFSCAFMLFHYDDSVRWDWRFTFCHKQADNKDISDSKRFTFLLGPGQACTTAANNFYLLYNKAKQISTEDLEEAFNVEALSKEFFEKYKEQYLAFVNYMSNPDNGMRQYFIARNFDANGLSDAEIRDREEKPIRDYVKKLLGRIVFLHFLQKKGWLGVPANEAWGKGDTNFMLHLFEYASEKQRSNFLDTILEPIFSEALDKNRKADNDCFDTQVEPFRNIRIPYLNGGLFERDHLDLLPSYFPAEYFENLLTMLSQYNFTIDENDPNDAEVGIDPEMLGRIFENLLEDNKDKGTFYTPREIVQYMCRESLIAYLQTEETEEDKERIRQFVTTHDVDLLGELRERVNKKLCEVKICDPAIGSGAFPMGLLRELFFCRSAIEPNTAENAANIKRHIIQNNIYGVDIERGAIDIARLRFWLSLIVDEKTPEALPNLDFKIMQGNSLLESYEGFDLQNISEDISRTGQIIFDDDTCNRALIHEHIRRYFTEDNHEERQLLREKINQAIKNLIIANNSISEDKVKKLDLSNNSEFFLWHTYFKDVFSSANGGFDIVIGNPPYIQLQNNGGLLAKVYNNCHYSTFARTGDIYCLFYERGWQLLKKGGHLCFITSNKWMRAGYGEKMREFLATKTNPTLLIDFAGTKIFDSATVDTNILLFSKADNQHHTLCAVTKKQDKNCLKNLSYFFSQKSTPCSFSSSKSWVILSPIEQSIKQKIEAIGTPLKDWDIQINYGIKTGCNEAFIISSAKRKEILNNCLSDDEGKRTDELIRPILRGRDIKRYGYEWADLWLIYIPWHFPYQFDDSIQGASVKAEEAFKVQYPAVYSHMLQYKESLLKRNKAETGIRYEWYAMQRWGAKYWEDFNKPKIIWKRIGSILRFSYDNKGCLGLDSTCFATGKHIEYLCCILNSLMGHYLLKDSPKTGTGDLLVSVQAIEPTCIPYNSQYDKQLSSLLSTQISNLSDAAEEEINDIVFTIYGLSPAEREYIKQFVKQSQQSL